MDVDKTTTTHRYVLMRQSPRLLLGVGLVLVAMSAHGVHATMPSAPLEMAVESTGVLAVDVDLTVTLTVRPLVDAARLALTITLPAGVDLVAGETAWVGPVRAQETRVLSVTVRPRQAIPAVIQAAARLEFPDGTVLGDTRSLTLALGDRLKPAIGISPPKKTTTGESVIEFRDVP